MRGGERGRKRNGRTFPPLLPPVRGVFPEPLRGKCYDFAREVCVRREACREAAYRRDWPGVDCSSCPVPPGATDLDVPGALRSYREASEGVDRAVGVLRRRLKGFKDYGYLRYQNPQNPHAPKGGEEKLEMSPRKGQKRTRYAKLDEFTGDAVRVLENALSEGWGPARTYKALARVLLPSELPSENGVARYLRRKRAESAGGDAPTVNREKFLEKEEGTVPGGSESEHVGDVPRVRERLGLPVSVRLESGEIDAESRERLARGVEEASARAGGFRRPAVLEEEVFLPMMNSVRLEGVGRPFEVRPDGSVLCPDAASAAALSLELLRRQARRRAAQDAERRAYRESRRGGLG